MRNDVEAEGREESGRNVVRIVLVMKCNKNVNIPYCGEYLSVDTGWCGVIGMVTKGKNIART